MTYINNRFLKGTKWWRTHSGLFTQKVNRSHCEISKYSYRSLRGQVKCHRAFRVFVDNEFVGQRGSFKDAETLALNIARAKK